MDNTSDREKEQFCGPEGLSKEMKALAGAQDNIRQAIVALAADLRFGLDQIRKDLGEMGLRHLAPSSEDRQSTVAQYVSESSLNETPKNLRTSVDASFDEDVLRNDSRMLTHSLATSLFTPDVGAEYGRRETPQHGVVGLHPTWPADLKPRQNLNAQSDAARRKALVVGSNVVDHHTTSSSSSEHNPRWRTSLLHLGVMNPNSLPRMCFEACGVVVLLYDLTLTPYLLAWNLGDNWLEIRYLGVMVAVYWTLDLVSSFNTGVYDDGDGELKLDRINIACNYLKSWFLLDFLLIVCEWLSIAFPQLSVMGMLKVGKLLRLRRLFGLVDNFNDRTLSETTRLAFRVASIVVAIFLFNHYMCCTWYAIGRIAPSDTGAHWLDAFIEVGVEERTFVELSSSYQYFTVLHWYFSQMTAGNQTIYCYSTAERTFNILGLLVGLFISCSLVSSLSTTMLEIQMANKDQKTKLRTLTQFLRENNVEPQVAVLVQKQVRERIHERDKLTQGDVPALALISSQLHTQLRRVIFAPHITRHPLFRLWSSIDDKALQNLCSQAVRFKFLRPQDDLFKAGATAENTYFFHSGIMKYVQEPELSPVEQETTTNVLLGTWLSEVALWMEDWTHVGSVEAVRQCKVLVVHAPEFMKAIPKYGVVQLLTTEYQSAFQRRLMTAIPPDAAWPSDLGVSLTDYCDLVPLMHLEAQVAIGLNALDHMSSRMWKKAWIDNLRREIHKGKCMVVLNESGEPERIASVLALHIVRADGSLLVKIGNWNGVQVESTCQLPGGKLESGEMLRNAMLRLLETKLKPLAGSFEITEIESQTTWQQSKEYQMRTKYSLGVCFGNLTAEIKAQICRARRGASEKRLNSHALLSRARSALEMEETYGDEIAHIASSVARNSSIEKKVGRKSLQQIKWKDVESKEILCFKVDDSGKWDLYAWLSLEEFDFFGSVAGESLLLKWVSAINFETLLAESDTATHDNPNLGGSDGTITHTDVPNDELRVSSNEVFADYLV